MNDQDYQFLLDLYETKNITKVAQQQFLTQPAMTKRIRRIEEELGCQLLLRSKRGVTFTAVGETVIRYCQRMLELNKQMRDSINQSQGIVGGSLSVGASLNYSRYRLPSALRHYQQLYPNVDVRVSTGHSRSLYHMLMEGKLSLAIIRGNFAWNDASILLSSEPVCLVRSHDNAALPLSDYTYIGHHTDPDEERRIEQWLLENNVTPNTRLWIDDISSCCEMAQAGVGWTIIPSICLDRFEGDVQPLSLRDGTPLLRNTYVLYRSSCYELQQVKLFLDILKENAAAYDHAIKGRSSKAVLDL